jgi:hypothetical protein
MAQPAIPLAHFVRPQQHPTFRRVFVRFVDRDRDHCP